MKAIIISREQDKERRGRIREGIPEWLDWSFLNASDGHQPTVLDARYRDLIAETFWGNKKIKPGAFGCFVSHYRAWLECSRANVPLLILEDDIFFSLDKGSDFDSLISNDWDVILVNKSAVAWNLLNKIYEQARWIPFGGLRRRLALKASRVAMERNTGDPSIVRSLREVMLGLVNSSLTPDSPEVPGANGYILMPNGAKKLLALADKLGVLVGVDWFILGSAMSGAEFSGSWSVPGRVAKYFENSEIVNIGVSCAWMVDSIDDNVGGSVINHTQLVTIEEYAKTIGTG